MEPARVTNTVIQALLDLIDPDSNHAPSIKLVSRGKAWDLFGADTPPKLVALYVKGIVDAAAKAE
jgi:hypothetical protein